MNIADFRYPWQYVVYECFKARPEDLPGRINVAERTISARLADLAGPALDERIALKSALRSLRDLLPDEKRPARHEEKNDIA